MEFKLFLNRIGNSAILGEVFFEVAVFRSFKLFMTQT